MNNYIFIVAVKKHTDRYFIMPLKGVKKLKSFFFISMNDVTYFWLLDENLLNILKIFQFAKQGKQKYNLKKCPEI